MSQDTERREQERLRRLGWEPTTPLPQVCDGPVTPQVPAPNRGQDTERLSDQQVGYYVEYGMDYYPPTEVRRLAREVQASRKRIAALQALCQGRATEILRLSDIIDKAGLS